MPIKIGELAKQTGCKVVTIRYYEKEGLLPKPTRSKGNYRLYDAAHVEHLLFIRHCRALDMTLEEIRLLLSLREQPEQNCSQVSALLKSHIQQIETHVQSLLELKQHLVSLYEKCPGQQSIESCDILQDLSHSHTVLAPAIKE